MLYRIAKITYSGTNGNNTRGLDRKDERYPLRINRIVDIDINDFKIGDIGRIRYVKDAQGNEYNNTLYTSTVISIKATMYTIILETINSIYIFESLDN